MPRCGAVSESVGASGRGAAVRVPQRSDLKDTDNVLVGGLSERYT